MLSQTLQATLCLNWLIFDVGRLVRMGLLGEPCRLASKGKLSC